MIQIKKLTKIYNQNKSDEVIALNDINLTLPDRGLVFILGKSGSGKSTLLNLLGSLDNITQGDIIADGYHLNSIKEEDATTYRNEYVGFIFQDYSLIDNLNVKENIQLPLLIKGIDDDKKVKEILDLIDLSGYENRKISTLSAGQKQRVAIARGYIKKPKLLLCDEPTGNLDSKTSEQILNLLKKLSKDTLVIVVSHNKDDALDFADRIIEIKDGEVFKDTIINKNPNTNRACEIRKNNGYSFKNNAKLALKFQNRRIISTFITSFFSSLLMIILCLCQFFISFDRDKVVQQAITYNNQQSLMMQKAYQKENEEEINTSKLISITNEDDQLVVDSGYDKTAYKIYNYSLPISLDYWVLQNESSIQDKSNLSKLYLKEIYGVAIVDEGYFLDVFNTSNLIAKANEEKSYGIIITDFIADSILYYRGDTFSNYEDILGIYRNSSDSIYAYINGIIETGYKNRYNEEFFNKINDSGNLEEFYLSIEYMSFIEDVKNNLGYAYSLNPNFIKDCTSPQARNIARLDNCKISLSFLGQSYERYFSNAYGFIDSLYLNTVLSSRLPANTIGVSLDQINQIVGKELTDAEINNLTNQKITLTKYRAHHPNDESVFEKQINIKVFKTQYFGFVISEDLFTYIREYEFIPYAYLFTDMDKIPGLYEALSEVPFVPNSLFISAGIEIKNVVIIFNDFFTLISLTLLLSVLLIICFNALNNVSNRKYEIGVFKAIGMPNKNISFIFIFQIIISTLVTILLFTPGVFIFTNITNNILFDSFMVYLKNPALKMINILTFYPHIFVLDIFVLFILNAITTLIPLMKMKSLKPLHILRRGRN